MSDPLRSSLGYHLLLVEEKTPEKEQEFKDVKDGIVKMLLEGKARSKTEEIIDELYEQAYRSEDLEAGCEEIWIELKKADSITRDGAIPGRGLESGNH